MKTVIEPDWPAPANVRALVTTRQGGMSEPPWSTFNLGLRSGDDEAHVRANRQLLQQAAGLTIEPQWLNQVHGTDVIRAKADGVEREADASVSGIPGLAAVVLTADCLPVLFCDRAGTVVAAAHAGWRGLSAGVLRNTISAMGVPPEQLIAWLGPAISQVNFEVGPEVQEAFASNAIDASHHQQIAGCFVASGNSDRQRADLYQLARRELSGIGVQAVYGGDDCTFQQEVLYYSYRRDGMTGRMASLIWLTNPS